jgi:hypothetical protein
MTFDSAKGTYMLLDAAVSGERNVIKKAAKKILKYKDLNNRNTVHLACKYKSDTTNSHKRKMTNAHILLTPLYERCYSYM